MAQVKGYRGKTNDFFDVSHRYKWDMYYVKNLSFKLDIQIIGLTITSTLAMIYTTLTGTKKEQESNTVVLSFESKELLN